jgi:hypothetical protein
LPLPVRATERRYIRICWLLKARDGGVLVDWCLVWFQCIGWRPMMEDDGGMNRLSPPAGKARAYREKVIFARSKFPHITTMNIQQRLIWRPPA